MDGRTQNGTNWELVLIEFPRLSTGRLTEPKTKGGGRRRKNQADRSRRRTTMAKPVESESGGTEGGRTETKLSGREVLGHNYRKPTTVETIGSTTATAGER